MKSVGMVDLSQPKLPPQNLEAEQSVLGAILLDNAAMPKAMELLVEEDFYRTAHKKVFQAMLELSDTGEVIDQITLTERLKSRGELEAIGGAAFLAELVQIVPSSANIRYHCKIIRDKAVARQLISTSTEVLTRGYEGTASIDDLLDFAERSVFSIAQGKLERSFSPISQVIKESLDVIDKLSKRKEHVTGVPTGYYDLDDITAGLQPSDLVVIAGRPSMGKTSLALGMAVHAAIHAGSVVGIFSLEMSKPQIVLRMLSSEARVDSHGLRTGKLQKEDWWRLAEAAGRLEQAPIYIDDTGGITVQQMRGKARRLKAERGLDLLIVDYLQLMQGRSDSESRQQEISDISRSLKALAKELNVPVVALSQLSRAVEARKPPVPMLADLRECVTGETLVTLSDGRRVPIKDLVDASPDVLAVSKEGRVMCAQSDKVWRVGRRPIFRVRLASGRTIRATAEHRLLGAGGWKRIKEMSVGDRLAVARELPEPSTIEQWPDRRIEVFSHVRQAMHARGISQRQMASLRGTSYGGASHFQFAPSRSMLAEYATILEDEVLASQATSDLFWDRILSIEPDGMEEVFDLTVPGPASWLADGVVSHNSGAIEQDADVVMFIYREDVYDQNSERKGIADILVSKHRNGPIGRKELFFHDRFAKFESLDNREVV